MLGQIRIDQMIGDGGMGTVYRCTDLAMNRVVAVKVLHAHLLTTDKWFLRFRQEAEAIGRLQHPAIIKIHQFSTDDPPFIVMDYVKGKSLSDVLAAKGSLSLERTTFIAKQIVDALAHAHSRGVVHRDLKPSNIMILAGDAIQVLDFGIAKLDDTDDSNLIKLTQTGEIFGSPAYMSPEQVLGKKVTAESDQYSIGCVLYECLTGSPPFVGTSPIDVMMKHASNEPPLSLREATLGQPFPLYIEELVKRLLSKKPEDRFRSMNEVSAALSNDKVLLPKTKVSAQSKTKIAKSILLKAAPLLVVGAVVSMGANFVFRNVTEKITVTAPTPGALVVPMPADKTQSNEDNEASAANQAFIQGLQHPGKAGLQCVFVRQNMITDDALAEVKKHPEIQELHLENCVELTNKGLKNLVGTKIVRLYLKGNFNISDEGIATLCQIKSLRMLDLQGTAVSDKGLVLLNELPQLVGINLCNAPNVKFSGLEKFLSGHKRLNFVRMDINGEIEDSDLHNLIRSLSEQPLEDLRADRADFHLADLQTLARIKTLKLLALSGTRVDNEGADAILKMKKLHALCVHDFFNVAGDKMAKLYKNVTVTIASQSR